jgi:hypothetical protein
VGWGGVGWHPTGRFAVSRTVKLLVQNPQGGTFNTVCKAAWTAKQIKDKAGPTQCVPCP